MPEAHFFDKLLIVPVFNLVRQSFYQDSVTLMRLTRDLESLPGIEKMSIERYAEMRYVGQVHELATPMPVQGNGKSKAALDETAARFHEVHRQRYAFSMPEKPVEILAVRQDVVGKRGWEIPERDATPEASFLDRRTLLKGAATGGILASAGLFGLGRAEAAGEPDPSLALYPANSIFVEGYLTTPGQRTSEAQRMIEELGFEVEPDGGRREASVEAPA